MLNGVRKKLSNHPEILSTCSQAKIEVVINLKPNGIFVRSKTIVSIKYDQKIVDQAVLLAEAWLNRANELLTAEEKGIQEQMKRLLTNPVDKVILTRLIDQSFRSHDPGRIADQINSLLREYGVPDFLSRVDKLLVQMFMGLGRHFPTLSVPKMIDKMRQDVTCAFAETEKTERTDEHQSSGRGRFRRRRGSNTTANLS
jgi:hypothetical protein